MKVSAKTDYACKALLELSLHWPNPGPLRVNEIAVRQNIPMKFLIHILISLKQLGVVQSIRGNQGGYILAKAPQEIKLGEVVNNFTETRTSMKTLPKKLKKSDVMESIWQEAESNILDILNNISFEEISQRYRHLEKIPMYTI